MFERETEKDFGDKWYQAGITALPHGDPGQTSSMGVQPRQSGQSSGGGSRASGGLGVPVPWGCFTSTSSFPAECFCPPPALMALSHLCHQQHEAAVQGGEAIPACDTVSRRSFPPLRPRGWGLPPLNHSPFLIAGHSTLSPSCWSKSRCRLGPGHRMERPGVEGGAQASDLEVGVLEVSTGLGVWVVWDLGSGPALSLAV